MIREKWPQYTFIQIKDAIDLMMLNDHVIKFPHNSVADLEHLRADYKGLYFRYITNDKGAFAYRSNFYRDDIIYNVVLSKFSVLQATLGVIIIWVISNVAALLWYKEKETPQPLKTIIIIKPKNKQDNRQIFDRNDTTIFLFDTAKKQ